MAKVAFTKLGLSKNQDTVIVTWNDQNIEVKQYLPVNDKLILISNVINESQDDNNFANPVKVDVYSALEVLYAYTNISFTEKQKEDVTKLYDLVISSGLFEAVKNAIPKKEYETLTCAIIESVDAVYAYRNSVLGLMESITGDYSGLSLEAAEIQKKLTEGNGVEFLQEVMAKLG